MIDALHAADPTRDQGFPNGLDERGKNDLRVILSMRRSNHPHGRTGLLAATAAAVVVAVASGYISMSHPQTVAAAPVAMPILSVHPLSASTTTPDRLLGLAGAVERTPDRTGPVHYRDWSLNVQIDEKVNTAIVSTEHVLSVNPDRSIHETARISGIDYPTAASRIAWEHDAPVTVGDLVQDTTYPAGQYPATYTSPAPAEPTALMAFLQAGHPIDEYGTGELFVAIADLTREQRLDGPQVGAILRVLAGRRDIFTLGTVQDRAGRTGLAFAADSTFTGLPTKHILIFEPTTGQLMASETWLTSSSGKLGISVPAATDYILIL